MSVSCVIEVNEQTWYSLNMVDQKTELLRMANALEETAKNEEIIFVRLYDLTGKYKEIHRYDLPHVAEGLRMQAELIG